MKGALAYIVAHSVWQFYESDWINTRWSSNTIQFVPTAGDDMTAEAQSRIFAWRPYFSIRFGERDADFDDYNAAGNGEIHQYPWIRALGIMLVEIAKGISLENSVQEGSEIAKRNRVWMMAKRYSESEKFWPEFPFAAYRTAVKHCLEPENFTLPLRPKAQARAVETRVRSRDRSTKTQTQSKGVLRNSVTENENALGKGLKKQATSTNSRAEEEADTLRRRRKILYEKVVSPLRNFVEVCGWINDLSALGPVEVPQVPQETAQDPEPTPSKKGASKDLRPARNWLAEVGYLNSKIISGLGKRTMDQADRIRTAVIDTGFEETVPFSIYLLGVAGLKAGKIGPRIPPILQIPKAMRTHLVSLIMTIAPDADIYVARVAEDRKGLETTTDEMAAEAIEWAWDPNNWNVDIISMSFGFTKARPEIEDAILRGVTARRGKILFFAAAANFGVREREMFPARCASVISIRGANANGFFQDFNPLPNEDEAAVFGTLGVDVPGVSLDGKQEPKSGSSIATAVAAGMAAVLLEYATWKRQESGDAEILRKLKTQKGMRQMFKSLAVPSLHDKRLLSVSLLRLRDMTEDERWALFQHSLANVD